MDLARMHLGVDDAAAAVEARAAAATCAKLGLALPASDQALLRELGLSAPRATTAAARDDAARSEARRRIEALRAAVEDAQARGEDDTAARLRDEVDGAVAALLAAAPATAAM